jgi:hypothetical protein
MHNRCLTDRLTQLYIKEIKMVYHVSRADKRVVDGNQLHFHILSMQNKPCHKSSYPPKTIDPNPWYGCFTRLGSELMTPIL